MSARGVTQENINLGGLISEINIKHYKMPCYATITHFQKCDHKRLSKLGCTVNCPDLCPPDSLKFLVKTVYPSNCVECHRYHFMEAAYQRLNQHEDNELSIKQDAQIEDEETRAQMLQLAKARADFQEELLDQRYLGAAQEIEAAQRWTGKYGKALRILDQHPPTQANSQPTSQRSIALRDAANLRAAKPLRLVVTLDASRTSAQLRDAWELEMAPYRVVSRTGGYVRVQPAEEEFQGWGGPHAT
ncbi:hypothetical protein CDD80_5907 [Ophiocordyceps camponoti-rufipedis]|uniref:Uncharacterized protein n=1 Tax=Ophiocordyceps camponoti-rufipedis TaxID=2004952 RepID=A0A2C5ZG29_9HYPO|nr:hypothetical protein CDD80_5907 [Ophiocordyceps camponoti-rufipedis]